MQYIFIQRPGDREKIIELVAAFKSKTKQELIEKYNNSVEVGIVGVHAQAQMLVALRNVFNSVFGKSPITIEDNLIIGLTGKIMLIGNDWEYCQNLN